MEVTKEFVNTLSTWLWHATGLRSCTIAHAFWVGCRHCTHYAPHKDASTNGIRLGLPLCGDGHCERMFQRSGRTCQAGRRQGLHIHGYPGLAGAHTRYRHNPLVHEFARILMLAGCLVDVESQGPAMGSNARLDIVEYPSEWGGPVSYDLSVATALRSDRCFVRIFRKCAAEAGHAASERHRDKLVRLCSHRLPGVKL